jgi:hypothetical protein
MALRTRPLSFLAPGLEKRTYRFPVEDRRPLLVDCPKAITLPSSHCVLMDAQESGQFLDRVRPMRFHKPRIWVALPHWTRLKPEPKLSDAPLWQ